MRKIVILLLLIVIMFLFVSGCCSEDKGVDCKKKCKGCSRDVCTDDYCAAVGKACDYAKGDGSCKLCATAEDCLPCYGCFAGVCRKPQGTEIDEFQNVCTSVERPLDDGVELRCNLASETNNELCNRVGMGQCQWCDYT